MLTLPEAQCSVRLLLADCVIRWRNKIYVVLYKQFPLLKTKRTPSHRDAKVATTTLTDKNFLNAGKRGSEPTSIQKPLPGKKLAIHDPGDIRIHGWLWGLNPCKSTGLLLRYSLWVPKRHCNGQIAIRVNGGYFESLGHWRRRLYRFPLMR
jgi:hypothetical protein